MFSQGSNGVFTEEPRHGRMNGVQIREVEQIVTTQASIIDGVGLKHNGKQKVVEQETIKKRKLAGSAQCINYISKGLGQSSSGIRYPRDTLSMQENEVNCLQDVERLFGSTSVIWWF